QFHDLANRIVEYGLRRIRVAEFGQMLFENFHVFGRNTAKLRGTRRIDVGGERAHNGREKNGEKKEARRFGKRHLNSFLYSRSSPKIFTVVCVPAVCSTPELSCC